MESRWSKRLVLARSPVGLQLLTRAAAVHSTICKAGADSAYRTAVIEHGATLGIDVEVVRRDPATRGFAALPRPLGRGADPGGPHRGRSAGRRLHRQL
jgi:hypothetical protein